MVYLQINIELPRHKVNEALEAYGATVIPWYEKHLPKVGIKIIGCWTTQFGKTGEITFLFAHPSFEASERLMELIGQDAEFAKWWQEVWYPQYAPFATFKVLRSASFSPLK